MLCTAYSALPVEDLVDYALQRDIRTDLEIELAQRLRVALDMLTEHELLSPTNNSPTYDA